MDRVHQIATSDLHTRPKFQTVDLPSDDFESGEERFKIDLRRGMFVANDDDSFAFGSVECTQLEAVADGADVSFVRVQEIDRPVFCLFAVVSERSSNLELESPAASDEEVWRAFRED